METRSHREEEYLEAMYLLKMKKGIIRVKDLAKLLKVKPSSVVEYLDKLHKKGLVHYEKHELISLTEKGIQLAEKIYKKHLALKEFLMLLLKIPEDIAEKDACNMEHGLHKETLEKIVSFIKHCRRRMNKDQERPARSQPL